MMLSRVLAFCFCLMLAFSARAAEQQEIPFREDSGLTKAEFLFTTGNFSAAIESANDVLARHPSNADAYTYRGYAYYRLGDMAEAAKNFRRALELNPTHLGANKYLADVYLEDGKVAQALEQLQVIRMTCGRTDCEELRSLQSAIDQYKRGERGDKKEAKE